MARHYHKNRPAPLRTLAIGLLLASVAVWGVWNAVLLQPALSGTSRMAKAPGKQSMQWVEMAAAQTTGDPFGDAPRNDAAPAPRLVAEVQRPMLTLEEITGLVDAGSRALEHGDVVTARTQLNAALAGLPNENRQEEIRNRLAGLNTPVFLGPDLLDSDPYVHMASVQPGDSFVKLGHRYKVPAEFIAAINPRLSPRNLRPGAGIKVVFGPFHARLVKHAARLDLYARDMYVRSFPISFDEGNFLPAGMYSVMRGGKIALGADRRWVLCEGLADDGGATVAACIYGSAGPRATGRIGLSGVRCSDEVLGRLYNAFIEQDSLLRVDP